jgi:hypothetical protein
MKLDPEHRIIAAALDQATIEEANERALAARIEFPHEGCAKVTMTVSRELVDRAKALNWSTGELFAEAIRIALPGPARELPARRLVTATAALDKAHCGEDAAVEGTAHRGPLLIGGATPLTEVNAGSVRAPLEH